MSGQPAALVGLTGPGRNLLAAVGRQVNDPLRLLGEWTMLWLETTRLVIRGQIWVRDTVRQIDAVGIGSVPLACLTVTFSSMVLALYSTDQLIDFGFTDFIGHLIGATVVRELGPVLTAIVVASREGSAIAAELASMKVTEQIDALRALATDPVEALVVPRYLACLVSLPLLTVLAGAAGITGGYLVAAASQVPQEVYWNSVARGVTVHDAATGLVKALMFGALIAVVSCHQGLKAGHGAEAVGRATTASVVLCVVLMHVADFALAMVFN